MSHDSRSGLVTKSAYLAWCRCPKLAWHDYHTPDSLNPPDAAALALMRQGYEVDRLAWKLFPGGVAIGTTGDVERDQARTTAALARRIPLFEATLSDGRTAVRTDILAPAGERRWDLFETKATTEVSQTHLQDVAFQWHVLLAAGLPMRRAHVLHLNRDYCRGDEVEPRSLLAPEDVTDQIGPLIEAIPAALRAIERVRSARRPPRVLVGRHCESPQRCPLHAHCWKRMPADHVFSLYRGGKKAEAWHHGGIRRIVELPANVELTRRQQIQKKALKSRRAHVDTAALRQFLDRLAYPLSLLDFEAYALAVPPFAGLRPYQQVPFQFSCHVVAAPDATPESRGHLVRERHDPRPEFMAELRRRIPAHGSIVVYNAAFEWGRLDECVASLPEYRDWLVALKPRFVDLLEPFREFQYYHPDQHGSASIKAVLPALTGRSYAGLEIHDGATAALRYVQVIFGTSTAEERQKTWTELEAYCGQDTLAMGWVIDGLRRLVVPSTRGKRRARNPG